MRRLVLLFAPAALAVPALVACEQDPTTSGQWSFDAGVGDVYVPPHQGDAVAPDAPAPSVVTVKVLGWSGPKANARVAFHDAAGAVLETKVTGSDGTATTSRPEVSMATALVGADSPFTRELMTWTGVELGDELVVRGAEASVELGVYQVTLFDLPQDAASSVIQSGWCRGEIAGKTGTIEMYSDCAEGKGAVLATALNPNFGAIGHAFSKRNPLPANGGSELIPSTSPWKQAVSLEVNVSNFGADDTAIALYEIADGQLFLNPGGRYVTIGEPTVFATADGFADAHLVTLTKWQLPFLHRAVMKRFAPGGASVSVDANQFLPPIASATLEAVDPLRPTVEWSLESPAATDGGLVRIRAFSPNDTVLSWSFVVAPDATRVTAPALPPELLTALEQELTGSQWDSLVQVRLIEADAIPSYEELRRTTTWASWREHENNAIGGWSFSANGTYRVTGFGPSED